MSLRVISGKAKGRKLRSVPGDTTRPITDRVKESLFNIISGDVSDSRWWDLFGGTGADPGLGNYYRHNRLLFLEDPEFRET